MHELSVAQSVVDFVCEQLSELDGSSKKVARVRVRIGVMSAIAPLALKSAYRSAVVGTLLQGCELEIETVDLVVWCPQCSREQLLQDTSRLRCPVCQTRTPQILQGKELEIDSIEVVDLPDPVPAPR